MPYKQPPKPIRTRLARIEIMKRCAENHRRRVAERRQTHRRMAAASRRRNRG